MSHRGSDEARPVGGGAGTDTHPRDIDLADHLYGTLTPDAEKGVLEHLARCVACSERIRGAAERLPPQVAPQDVPRGPVMPEQLRMALSLGRVGTPADGQLWRLRGPGERGELSVLAAIVRSEEDHLWVVPVTPDRQEATDLWTAQLPVGGTDLVMAFWTSLATPVGYEVLDVWLGWTQATPLRQLFRAQRRGLMPPAGLAPLGRELDEELADYRLDLGAELQQLQDARLVPDTPDSVGQDVAGAGQVAGSEEGPTSLRAVLQREGWRPSQLKAVAGNLTAGEAAAVLAGTRALDEEQVGKVSAALGIRGLPAHTQVDWRWVHAVATPLRRQRYERLAAAESVDGWEYRARIAQHPEALAARSSRSTVQDWDHLAEQQLRAREQAAGL